MSNPSTHVLLESVDGRVSVTVGIGEAGLKKLQEKFEGCLREYCSEMEEADVQVEVELSKEENWNWTDIESGSGPYELSIVAVENEDVLY